MTAAHTGGCLAWAAMVATVERTGGARRSYLDRVARATWRAGDELLPQHGPVLPAAGARGASEREEGEVEAGIYSDGAKADATESV